MMRKRTASVILFYICATVVAALIMVPFFWMVSTSLKERGALLVVPVQWIPKKVSFAGYAKLFTLFPFGRAVFNSALLSVSITVITLLSAAMAAFAFSKIEFKAREGIFKAFLLTMMIPGQVTMIPLFIVMNKLTLVNTYQGLILPCIFNSFAVFMLRQQMLTIPNDYLDAAVMDGASNWYIFRRIVVPLSSSILATLGVLTFMGTWNDYFWPLIMISDKNKMTLPVALSQLNGQYSSEYNVLMAGALLSMLPIIALYLAAQKYFKAGLQLGGLKG
jgi:multiple sugar transport system permease protein